MAYTKATKENLLPTRKPTRDEIELKKKMVKSGYKVDLNNLDVHTLTNELIAGYSQNNDIGIIRGFFRRNRVESQEKFIRALLNKVQAIRDSASTLIEYKAQLMSQQQVLESLIIGKIDEAQFAVDQQREEHQTFLDGQTAERERIWLELDRAKNENEKMKYEVEKAKWEAEEAKHRARIIELRGALIEKIKDEVKFSDINMKQVFVLIEMIKEATTDADIITAEARWEQLRAEAKKTSAQANQEETKADWERYKFEQDSKKPSD